MGRVFGVHRSTGHHFSKIAEEEITLARGLGVEGDAHAGATVRHRSRVARDPSQPNLRQVHLIQAELFDELVVRGHAVFPGDLGENITTRAIDLLALPLGRAFAVRGGRGGGRSHRPAQPLRADPSLPAGPDGGRAGP